MKKICMSITCGALMIFMISSMGLAADGDLTVSGDLKVSGNFNLLPAGTLNMYCGATPPAGWLLADGSEISRTTYAALFAAIGTTFGAGDGTSTFNLPDFRGVFPKGAGTTNRADGKDASGNYYSGTIGTYSQDKMQGHRHTEQTLYSNAGYGYGGFLTDRAPAYQTLDSGDPKTDGVNDTPRTGHTTEPQSLGVNFIIKY